VEFLKMQPGTLHVCLEEGGQSGWVTEILSPHAARVVVAHRNERSPGPKNDEGDAYGLAEQLRIGAIRSVVFKETGDFARLRQLVKAHLMIVRDTVRVQNRIKALLLSRGVHVEGKTLYRPDCRAIYLEGLPESARGAACLLLAQYDAIRVVRDQAE